MPRPSDRQKQEKNIMKAIAIFPVEKKVQLIDHPEPVIQTPTEIKLKILEVGVCGTDREISSFKYGTPPSGSDYLVIGHESLGTVVEIGKGVKRFKKGDLVVLMVRRPCLHPDCKACKARRPDFCITGDFRERGIKGLHGFMTEYVVDDEKYMNPVPKELREVAILTEPLTIAEKALQEVWNIQRRLPWMTTEAQEKKQMSGFKAVVLGAGPVGLLGTMVLRDAGFRTYGYSIEPSGSEKAKVVSAMGAAYLSAQDHSFEDLVKITGNIDIIYEATGASKFSFDVMPYLGTNGIFVFTGIPGIKAKVEIDADTIMKNMVLKNQVIFGTVNAGQSAFESAIRDLDAFYKCWPAVLKAMITKRCEPESFSQILQGPSEGIKNVITFDKTK